MRPGWKLLFFWINLGISDCGSAAAVFAPTGVSQSTASEASFNRCPFRVSSMCALRLSCACAAASAARSSTRLPDNVRCFLKTGSPQIDLPDWLDCYRYRPERYAAGEALRQGPDPIVAETLRSPTRRDSFP